MILRLNPVHFPEFDRLAEPGLPWTGHVPTTWARPLAPEIASIALPEKDQDRNELRAYCQDPAVSDESCFIACMAWGKMRRDHFQMVWAARDRLMPLVRTLRTSGLSREDAYHHFQATPIPHLGPAYYTKLIFFLRQATDGYVMDQWTGKSVSLVVTPVFIKIQGEWVTSANNADSYPRYCEAVELVATAIGKPGDVTERMLFSMGQINRKPRHAWRAYVHRTWPNRNK
jgi:hypothetical protein